MGKSKIVIVDDSPSMRALAKARFTRSGFVVFDTDEAEEALKLVFDERPDVVLLDLFMPGFPTEELIEQVKKARVNCNIPMQLLIYSGRSSHEIRELAALYEVDGYIEKMQGIGECVNSVMERLRLRAVHEPVREPVHEPRA